MRRFALLAALVAPLPAMAQAEDADGMLTVGEEGGRRIIVKARTEIEFGELDIDAKVDGPSLVYTMVPPGLRHNSLFSLRTNFDSEMAQSIDYLR